MNEQQRIDENNLLKVLKKGVKEQRVFTDALLGELNIDMDTFDNYKYEFDFKTEQEYISF